MASGWSRSATTWIDAIETAGPAWLDGHSAQRGRRAVLRDVRVARRPDAAARQRVRFAVHQLRRAVVREIRGPRATRWSGFDNRDVGPVVAARGPDLLVAGHGRRRRRACSMQLGAERAHVHGVSMGGMIVQWVAIDHRPGCSSMTSVMSTHRRSPSTGAAHPRPSPQLTAPPATTRAEHLDQQVAARRIYGSKPGVGRRGPGPGDGGAGLRPAACTRRDSAARLGAIIHDTGRAQALRSVCRATARGPSDAGARRGARWRAPARRCGAFVAAAPQRMAAGGRQCSHGWGDRPPEIFGSGAKWRGVG